ncbi:MAG: UDP-N-acetylmuramoyl-L-alanyl-D-glutamate--2,6-diaminopimelate ligase [Rhodocyclaceae bacterium]|nr:UDP-N-acetylmuramoyl-L-alanyl-D-glutamate--2,6-diaminopimelate ligase [Rhodocyclaceae bacterium]
MSSGRAATLLTELAARGVTATGLATDSRTLQPGDVFLAWPGARDDARRHIGDALARGAAAVLYEPAGFEPSESGPTAVPLIAVDGLRALSGYLADALYGHPSAHLFVVGVTGTNGKTSVSQWIAQSLCWLGERCAVVGTLGAGFPELPCPSATPSTAAPAEPGAPPRFETLANTTPDAVLLHRLLADFLADGADAVAMEVSSIGLDQHRVAGVAFDVAVLTNLTRDHLDYHGSMDAYGAAKAALFDTAGLGAAVLNLDDTFGRRLADRICRRPPSSRPLLIGTCTQAGLVGCAVDRLLHAEAIDLSAGLAFDAVLSAGGRTLDRARITAELIGAFNVANLLAVLAVLGARGIDLQHAATACRALSPPPGRMQRLGGDDRPLLVIDYAHTPDALEQALRALRPVASARGGRLHCVFGCGGERDPGKRPLMGGVACRLADHVVLTSDNPRHEDPQAIIADIRAGCPADARYEVEAERAHAVMHALRVSAPRDVILIAGKGHEAYQDMGGQRTPYSDIAAGRAALAAWSERAA